ncbi:MAG: hypothetical protein M0C28_03465 [Candidatus Moduliflexus flocculans]|nr:hypothetical protein [Candidatus Moduliflexus flocculans]
MWRRARSPRCCCRESSPGSTGRANEKNGDVSGFTFHLVFIFGRDGLRKGARRGGQPTGRAAVRGRSPAGTEFGYPIGGEPWYFVRCALELAPVPEGLEGAAWSVDRVEVDGVRARDFLVYQGGREVDKLGDQGGGREDRPRGQGPPRVAAGDGRGDEGPARRAQVR